MTLGGMGFIPERLLIMMMIDDVWVLTRTSRTALCDNQENCCSVFMGYQIIIMICMNLGFEC